MSGEPAASGAGVPRVTLIDDGKSHDVFEVLAVTESLVRMRSAFLFEVGEEINVRIERDGRVSELGARVRAHVTDPGGQITELELFDQAAVAG
ncbi:MAG: hypothetical protein JWO36_2190 [Myxococcales bacterium]|nr:hypothetical protein [Myxococcales bacterium]